MYKMYEKPNECQYKVNLGDYKAILKLLLLIFHYFVLFETLQFVTNCLNKCKK